MKQFEIGKTYYARSICNQECVFKFKVIGRTAKTVTLQDKARTIIGRRRVSTDNGEEYIKGRYSMAPILRASNIYEEE